MSLHSRLGQAWYFLSRAGRLSAAGLVPAPKEHVRVCAAEHAGAGRGEGDAERAEQHRRV